MNTIILIPPSERKAVGGTFAALKSVHPITQELIVRIQKADPVKLYGLKEKALQNAIFMNSVLLTSKTLPAIKRYTGVVYDAIDYMTLENKELFNQCVRIVSGLFGLIHPTMKIPNYKLKIDKLKAAQKWSNENSKQLKGVFVIDLLPQAHKKAVFYDQGIVVKFVNLCAGKRIPAGHQGKYIKGRFIRWLIENNIPDVNYFSQFTEGGYVWNGELFLRTCCD